MVNAELILNWFFKKVKTLQIKFKTILDAFSGVLGVYDNPSYSGTLLIGRPSYMVIKSISNKCFVNLTDSSNVLRKEQNIDRFNDCCHFCDVITPKVAKCL